MHSQKIMLLFDRPPKNFISQKKIFWKRGVFCTFMIFFYVRYSTQLHLPNLRFHSVGGCWDRTQDRCDIGIDSQTLTTRPDIIHFWSFARISSNTPFGDGLPKVRLCSILYVRIICSFLPLVKFGSGSRARFGTRTFGGVWTRIKMIR